MCLIRRAKVADLRAAAEVYLAAFPDTLRDLGAEDLAPEAIEDLFAICIAADPEGFLVAEVAGRIAGYVICPLDVAAIRRAAVSRGSPLRLLWRWLTRRYNLPPAAAFRALRDAIHLWRAEDPPGADCPAHILSIAVHPNFQGRGIGRKLLDAALASLRSRGAKCVRLEVRPHNTPARRLYESFGFKVVGTIYDTRGPWLVMVLRWSLKSDPPGHKKHRTQNDRHNEQHER